MKKSDIKIITRKDGRKQAKITLYGKRFTVTARDEETIYKKIEALENTPREELLKEPEPLFCNETVTSYIVKWFKLEKSGKISYTTEQCYRALINLYIIPFLGDLPLRDVKQFHVQSFINSMEDKSWSYQSKALDILRQMFDSAIINELIAINPVIRIKKCGKKTKEKEALTPQQISILLNSLTDVRQQLFVYLCLYCGLRRGEIFALDWSDVDFKQRCISISKSLSFEANQGFVKEPKSKAGNRIVAMPQVLYELLKRYEKPKGFIITDTNGNQITKMSARRLWLGILKGIQKPTPNGEVYQDEKSIRNNTLFRVTPHILRHSYCTNLYYAGVDLQSASKLMGHSSIEITDKVYTHLDTSYADNSLPKLDDYWNGFYTKNGCKLGAHSSNQVTELTS